MVGLSIDDLSKEETVFAGSGDFFTHYAGLVVPRQIRRTGDLDATRLVWHPGDHRMVVFDRGLYLSFHRGPARRPLPPLPGVAFLSHSPYFRPAGEPLPHIIPLPS